MSSPFRFRAELAWGDPEVVLSLSLEGIIPEEGFHPDTRVAYMLKSLPEDSRPHTVLRWLTERNALLRYAVVLYGIPDIFMVKDLRPVTIEGGEQGVDPKAN